MKYTAYYTFQRTNIARSGYTWLVAFEGGTNTRYTVVTRHAASIAVRHAASIAVRQGGTAAEETTTRCTAARHDADYIYCTTPLYK